MKADPDAQRRLLELQAIDTALTQLAHRRRNLPEYAEIERLDGQLRSLRDQRARAQADVDDLDRDIRRLENDIDQVRMRAERDQARLTSGRGTAKELESTQHELGTLARRQSDLEDVELELLEKRETAQSTLEAIDSRVGSASEERAAAEARRDAALADIAKDEEWKRSGRAPLVSTLPSDLVALYDKIREATGLGAAALRQRRCEGCRIELSGSDLGRVRGSAPDEVVRCEECRRILVRTEESGL